MYMLSVPLHVWALLFANARMLTPAPKSMIELLDKVSAPMPGVTVAPESPCSLNPAVLNVPPLSVIVLLSFIRSFVALPDWLRRSVPPALTTTLEVPPNDPAAPAFSVPALMGSIMCMGVATANSILIVSFAKERLIEHSNAVEAAIEAGFTRFRPVLMTALAMIIGMVPMALGMGDGGEQNAPLGRAVIGGLLCATVATLIFVPAVFSIFHGRRASLQSQTDPL